MHMHATKTLGPRNLDVRSKQNRTVTFSFTDFSLICSNTNEVLEQNKTAFGVLGDEVHTFYRGVLYFHNVMCF